MTEVGESVFVPEPPKSGDGEEDDSKKKVNVRLAMFFDGTLNNRANIEERKKEDSDIYREHNNVGSYNNELSNIALLEKHLRLDEPPNDIDHVISVYTEGAGTENFEDDSASGYALGVFSTGIDSKVEKGIKEAVEKIDRKVSGEDLVIKKLIVDLFGFSRGAASARYCIHKMSSQGSSPIAEEIELKGVDVSNVIVNFVGLYDTVSSHGLSFSNDVKALNLDSISSAKSVVQLAASEEYRSNFSLTNIQSAVTKGNGREVFLPGAHSDVGGGYPDGGEDQLVLVHTPSVIRKDREWLTSQGWYKSSELSEVQLGVGKLTADVGLKAKRSPVKNSYSKIPLKIMAQFCRQEGLEIVSELSEKASLEGDSESLKSLESVIFSYVSSGKPSKPEDWQAQSPLLKEVRHKYLHMSSRYDLGMRPRLVGGERRRKVYEG